MREIEFRGKTKTTKDSEWVYGYYYKVKSFFNNESASYITAIRSDHLTDFSVNEVTIGQYTGLKDKNGKKIYVGDIVLYAKYYKYIVCFGEHNKNPENCAEAIEVGFYLKSIKSKIMQYEEITPLYSIDGIAARFPKHCAVDDSLKESVNELKLEAIGNIWDNAELLKEEI